MTFFWILWIFSAMVSLVPVYFFLVGLKDGSITSNNIRLWISLLLAIGVILVGSYLLESNERTGLAKGMLFVIAVPGVLGLFYLLVVMINKSRWN